MGRHIPRPCGRAATALLALIVLVESSSAAPAPMERQPNRTRHLSRGDFVGEWTLVWSGQSYAMTLSAAGDYVCRCGVTTYVGTWSLDNAGRIWISETATFNPASNRVYAVRLDPWTLSGRVENGSPGTSVRLVRVR